MMLILLKVFCSFWAFLRVKSSTRANKSLQISLGRSPSVKWFKKWNEDEFANIACTQPHACLMVTVLTEVNSSSVQSSIKIRECNQILAKKQLVRNKFHCFCIEKWTKNERFWEVVSNQRIRKQLFSTLIRTKKQSFQFSGSNRWIKKQLFSSVVSNHESRTSCFFANLWMQCIMPNKAAW